MKIYLEEHNSNWCKSFEAIKKELMNSIGFLNPQIEHIGSTSVEGLAAKPVIDILVGLRNEDELGKVIQPLLDKGYIYYERYNENMPYRRFFVKHKAGAKRWSSPGIIMEDNEIPKSTTEHNKRLAHVHILTYGSEHWIRHIAFRDYLRTSPSVKDEYQKLKEQLSTREWSDGNQYNGAKNDFIKKEEQQAISWYKGNKTDRYCLRPVLKSKAPINM